MRLQLLSWPWVLRSGNNLELVVRLVYLQVPRSGPSNLSDSNFDGCVQLNDLLDLLSAYGDCGVEESAWQCGDPLEYQVYDYETVQIGERCWFAENLRNEHYQNGDTIPTSLSDNDWSSRARGQWRFTVKGISNVEM